MNLHIDQTQSPMNYRLWKPLFLALALVWVCVGVMYAQDVTKQDLEALEQRVEQKMEKSQAETQAYVNRSDTLNNRFIDMVSVLWGVAGLLLGGLIAMMYQAAKQRFMLRQESKYAQFTEQIDRLTETEANTMYLKSNAYVLFVHKDANFDKFDPFLNLRKLIMSEYAYADYVIFNEMKDWQTTAHFQQVIGNPNKLVLVVMNDDLLNDLKVKENGKLTDQFTEEGKAILQPFFQALVDKKVGFFNVGRSYVKGFYPRIGNHYLGYSNEAYTAYSNINNLLKYMMYAKGIKAPQKRKF